MRAPGRLRWGGGVLIALRIVFDVVTSGRIWFGL